MKSLLKYSFRGKNQLPSKWLPANLCQNAHKIDSICLHCINSAGNLTSLIYENEKKNNIKFFSEGLIKTYPTAKFIFWLKNEILNILPNDLKSLSFSDIISYDSDNTLLVNAIDVSQEHDGVSAMIAVVVPWNSDDDFKLYLDKIVDQAYIFGYDLSSIDKLQHDCRQDITVYIVQFEARFSNQKFELADTLLHISPLTALDKIRKNGLVPKSKSTEFKYIDRIYLFNQCSKQEILDYAKYKSENSNGFCVFKIQKEKLVNDKKYKSGKLTFYVDTAFQNENETNIKAIFTYNNIGLDLIDDYCLVFKDFSSEPKILKFKNKKEINNMKEVK